MVSPYEQQPVSLELPRHVTVNDLMAQLSEYDPQTVLSLSLTNPQTLAFSSIDFYIHKRTRMIEGPEAELLIPKKEFDMLEYIAGRAPEITTREDLEMEFFPWSAPRALAVHIKRIRDRLDSIGVARDILQTYKGFGYGFGAMPDIPKYIKIAEDGTDEPAAASSFTNHVVGPSATVCLSERQAAILKRLHDSAGNILAPTELGYDESTKVLRVHVLKLRKNLELAGLPADTIRTVRGVGYILQYPLTFQSSTNVVR